MGPLIEREETVEVASPEETTRLGERLGRLLRPGDFVGLIGELGAGKTHLVRGIAGGAAVPRDVVSSPTFAIVATYRGRLLLHHADLYRLADEDELYATGFFDLLGGEGAAVVEWLDRVPRAAPAELVLIRIEVVDEHRRRLHLFARGARPAQLLEAWTTTTR